MQAKVAWPDVMHLLFIRPSPGSRGLMENAEKGDTVRPDMEQGPTAFRSRVGTLYQRPWLFNVIRRTANDRRTEGRCAAARKLT